MSNECLTAVIMDALNKIAMLSYTDPKKAISLLGRLPNAGFPLVHDAVLHLCFYNLKSLRDREPEVRREFYKNIGVYLPGAVAVKANFNVKNKPDGFVRMADEVVPVEIKRDAFDAKALKQLQRYMRVYKSQKGVAVAPALDCDLPENVVFVAVGDPSLIRRQKRLRRAG